MLPLPLWVSATVTESRHLGEPGTGDRTLTFEGGEQHNPAGTATVTPVLVPC